MEGVFFNMPQTGNIHGSTLYIDSHDNISRLNILAKPSGIINPLNTGVDDVDD
jgi:hypothetical protein